MALHDVARSKHKQRRRAISPSLTAHKGSRRVYTVLLHRMEARKTRIERVVVVCCSLVGSATAGPSWVCSSNQSMCNRLCASTCSVAYQSIDKSRSSRLRRSQRACEREGEVSGPASPALPFLARRAHPPRRDNTLCACGTIERRECSSLASRARSGQRCRSATRQDQGQQVKEVPSVADTSGFSGLRCELQPRQSRVQ